MLIKDFYKLKSFLLTNTSVFKNFISLNSITVLKFIFPLLILPYLVRIVGVENYGKIVFAETIMLYFTIFTNYGFVYSGTSQISIFRNIDYRINKIFSTILLIRFFFLLICFGLLIIFLYLFIDVKQEYKLYIYSFGIVIGESIVPSWLFQGKEKMKYLIIIQLISKLIYTIFIILFITKKEYYYLVNLFNSIGYIFAAIISIFISIRYFKIKIIFPKWVDILYQLKNGYHIFITTFGIQLYRNSSLFLLGIITQNNYYVGIYSAAEKIIKSIQICIQPMAESLYPNLTHRFSNHSFNDNIKTLFTILKYYSVILFIFSILLFVFSPFLIKLIFGNDFYYSSINLRIMSFVLLFGGLNYFIGIIGFLNLGYKKQYTFFVFISAFSSIIIAWILIPFYNAIGSSIAFLSGELLLVLFVILFLIIEINRKKLNFKFNSKRN